MGSSNYHLEIILQEAVSLQPLYDEIHSSSNDPTCFLIDLFVVEKYLKSHNSTFLIEQVLSHVTYKSIA
jgi:hypothetical protein